MYIFIVKKDTTIKIGVVGAGHLGNFHLKQLKGIPHVSISGLYDSNPKRADEMCLLHNVHAFLSLDEILNEIYSFCYKRDGSMLLSTKHQDIIYQVGNILNISWLIDAIKRPVDIICQRSTNCPRINNCENFPKSRKKISWTNQIKKDILNKKK